MHIVSFQGKIFCVLLLAIRLLSGSALCAKEIVTNPARADGFGVQYFTIICSILYAEMENKPFCYTPFYTMEHNYDGDPDFLKKKEWLVNLLEYYPVNFDKDLQASAGEYIWYFKLRLHTCAKSPALKKIKQIFRANKKRSQYFDERFFNIAVHIRRHNAHDCMVKGTDTPDQVYVEIIERLREKYADQNPLFHLYSQGNEAEFREIYKGDDLVFHIGESIEATFTAFVLADLLVTSRSTFSYTAALLSDGIVYYMSFWYPPFRSWQKIESLSPLMGEREGVPFRGS